MTKNSLKNSNNDEIFIHQNPLVRWIFLISGFVLVAVGIIGMFLPLLPTTIFFILAAWCFARSSERFHFWLHNNRFFGKYLKNYRVKGGMTVRSKVITIIILLAGILFSIFYATDNIIVRILLAAILIGVSWHLIVLKTITEDKESN